MECRANRVVTLAVNIEHKSTRVFELLEHSLTLQQLNALMPLSLLYLGTQYWPFSIKITPILGLMRMIFVEILEGTI